MTNKAMLLRKMGEFYGNYQPRRVAVEMLLSIGGLNSG